jgi:signal transduction histidine kinase/ActR/RegA family two-component response regulator
MSPLRRALEFADRLAGAPTVAEGDRAQLLVRAWLFCSPILAMTGALYALGGLWAQAFIQWATIAAGALLVWLFVATRRLELCSQLSVAVGSLTFAAGSLAQSPPDVTSAAWLGLAPLLASLLLPPRVAVVWLVAESALAVTVVFLGHAGYHLSQRDEHPELSSAVNITLMFAVMSLLGAHHRRRMELQLGAETANRAKGLFLATIGHELRTPMNGMLGMTELLVETEPPGERREQLRTILRSERLLGQLVNDLLDLTRVETGKLTLRPVDTDLLQLVHDLEQLFGPLARERGLGLALAIEAPLPRVRVDALRLRQVLSNLLGNGLKFTEAGRVTLAVAAGPTGADGLTPVSFAVTDTGEGIRADVLPRLFLPFEQGVLATRPAQDGVGLGLAIGRQLVSLLGGQLLVETAPGRGSRFWFELRLPGPQAPEAAAEPELAPARSARTLPVLVVDDNPINLKVASALVERAGYPVVTACDGQAALEALRAQPFAAVLLDCQMPVLDGPECARRILALGGALARIPLIAVSASAAPDEVERCRAAGMCDFVAKPLSYAALTSTLQRYVP